MFTIKQKIFIPPRCHWRNNIHYVNIIVFACPVMRRSKRRCNIPPPPPGIIGAFACPDHRYGHRIMTSNRRATQCYSVSAPLMFVCPRSRFAHLGRHLPSQSISHKHMAISQECSQRLRISLRYACKYLTCRKFEKKYRYVFYFTFIETLVHKV